MTLYTGAVTLFKLKNDCVCPINQGGIFIMQLINKFVIQNSLFKIRLLKIFVNLKIAAFVVRAARLNFSSFI